MSHNNLIRGFLLSTLVWTLPINFELEKTLAQSEIVQSSDITQQEEKRQDYKKLLQKTNELYEKAAKFSQAVDQLNIELQEEFDSTKKINNINLKPVLAQKKEFNKIWQEFDKELETKSELAKFPKKKEIEITIGSLEALLSALDSSVKKPSSLTIATRPALTLPKPKKTRPTLGLRVASSTTTSSTGRSCCGWQSAIPTSPGDPRCHHSGHWATTSASGATTLSLWYRSWPQSFATETYPAMPSTST